jgi:hypothetical protein
VLRAKSKSLEQHHEAEDLSWSRPSRDYRARRSSRASFQPSSTAARNRWTSRRLCISESLTRANRQERAGGPKDSSRQEQARC